MWASFSKNLGRMESAVSIFLMVAATAVLFINVILRYFFGQGFSWAEEFIAYAMIWVTFLGAALAARKKSHVAMTIIIDSLKSVSIKRIYTLLIIVITTFFCYWALSLGIKQVLFLKQVGQTSPAMRLPMYIPYLAIPVGFGLMIIRFIEQIVAALKPSRNSDNRG